MPIEVATPEGTPEKEKGDLLEKLAEEFLITQNFKVATQVRITASELDLLCEHKANKKQVYVECKAHRATLSAKELTNVLGTLTLRDYQEAWLISTGPLGKDAKGFQHDWESKPADQRQKLTIYTPERILEALQNANVIKCPPVALAVETVGGEELLGEWLLLITATGKYWVVPCLSSGVPVGALVFVASTGKLVNDKNQLRNIAKTDTSQNSLDFEYVFQLKRDAKLSSPRVSETETVVEVQYGETWSDYRPARPEHFVGRDDAQKTILQFLKSVRGKKTGTRVFAITGNSGMGKSSLVTKLRSISAPSNKKIFVYAVDVRAAKSSGYSA